MTENGWPPDTKARPGVPIPREFCALVTIPGTSLKLLFQKDIPAIILPAFMADLNQYIEPVHNSRGLADEGSFTPSNSVDTSNHLGATAYDYNWSDHPLGVKDGGWGGSVLIQGSQVPAVRELLAWYEGMVFWGNDWRSPVDGMHFQMGYNTFNHQERCWNFINRKIRADGFSVWRRGGVPRGGGVVEPNPVPPKTGFTDDVLAKVMDNRVSMERYAELYPLVMKSFQDCGCNNVDRRAMWVAQMGHESGGLRHKEEIADGSAYEGRCRGLGNCQEGDGRRFKGRGFIQLTGRSHYQNFSKWAHDRGLVSSPSFFVDDPEALERDDYSMLAVTFYWTTRRSVQGETLNGAADARNLQLATQLVNGGQNGFADRKKFYDRALQANADMLDPVVEQPPVVEPPPAVVPRWGLITEQYVA